MGAKTIQDHQDLPAAPWQDAWRRRAQLLALAFDVPKLSSKVSRARAFPMCCSQVWRGPGTEEQCGTLKNSKVEGYLLTELVEASKASLGKHPPLPVLFPPVHSSPSPTVWGTGFVSLLFTGCRKVLGCYQHLLLFGLTQVFCLIFILFLSTHVPWGMENSPLLSSP